MFVPRLPKGSLAALGAGTAGLVLMAGPALAAAPYTVEYNGNTTGDYSEIATVKSPGAVLSDNGLDLSCTNSSLTLTVHTGTNSTGDDIADIAPASFSDCNFAGLDATVNANTSPAWQLNATGGNTSGSSDTITGNVSGISADVSIDGPLGTCSFHVAGSVDGTFLEDNGKGGQELQVGTSHLQISNVQTNVTCLGLVSEGDVPTYSGDYNTANQYVQIS